MNAVVTTIAPDAHDRSRYIGGSDIAAIMGLTNWSTPVQLYAKKIRPIDEAEPEPAASKRAIFRRGKDWEQYVGGMLRTQLEKQGHKVEIVASNRRFQDAEHSMFAAEIDFELRLNDEPDLTNAEIKTVGMAAARSWGESESEDLPTYYTAQAMWGLGVAPGRRQRCIVGAGFGFDELRTFTILRDDETLAGMRSMALSFWNNHVLARVPPEPRVVADLDVLFKLELRPIVIATPEMEEAVRRLRHVKAQQKALDAERDLEEFRIKRFMRDAAELLLDGEDKPAVTWKNRGFSTFDSARLKEEQPAIHKQYARKGETRVFTTK
jgi:putative phage-type endonuclease